METVEEPNNILEFRQWLKEQGAYIHPDLYFAQSPAGMGLSVLTRHRIEKDAKTVSCPVNLIITAELAQNTLTKMFNNLCPLNEREAICTYVALQACLLEQGVEAIIQQSQEVQEAFKHLNYISILPRESLSAVYFSHEELELLRGSNLYYATHERRLKWRKEWERSKSWLESVEGSNGKWVGQFNWDKFLRAQTWLASRAYPSSLLDNPPSLSAKNASPMLVPLMDSLNHARGTPVSWMIDPPSSEHNSQLSMVMHKQFEAGDEVFNNYGPKPNDELLLGYGFVIPNNPDDTLLLKLPGNERRYKVGRGATGEAEAVWGEIGRRLQEEFASDGDDLDVMQAELELEIGQILPEMLQTLRKNLPVITDIENNTSTSSDFAGVDPLLSATGIRPQVRVMISEYVKGQREILDDLLAYSDRKLKAAVNKAVELGIEVTLESDEDEDDNDKEREI